MRRDVVNDELCDKMLSTSIMGNSSIPLDIPCYPTVILILCGISVWNLHGKEPPQDLGSWIPHDPADPTRQHHLYVIGTCESCQTIKQAMICKKRSKVEKFEQALENFLADGGRRMYKRIKSLSIGAIHLICLAHRSVADCIDNLRTSVVATGFGNVVGNKGRRWEGQVCYENMCC